MGGNEVIAKEVSPTAFIWPKTKTISCSHWQYNHSALWGLTNWLVGKEGREATKNKEEGK